MTWPGWGEVFPALVALLATLGAVIGGMVALARFARPWMREAAIGRTSRAITTMKTSAEPGNRTWAHESTTASLNFSKQ